MTLHQQWVAFLTIVTKEVRRFLRIWPQTLLPPAITMTLYFVIFGNLVGSRIGEMGGFDYMQYIVPGLIMMSMFTESIFNASFGIYMPKFTGTIYELLSAPVSAAETVIAYVGAAATKSLIVGTIIFVTAHLFVDIEVAHPIAMAGFMVLIAVSFCLFGFILGIWAQSFEQLQVIPLLLIMPMTFLGGAFYSVHMLAEPWRTITLFNPIVYLISGFRWTFFGKGDVGIEFSLAFVAGMLAVCIAIIGWIFRTGYRLKK